MPKFIIRDTLPCWVTWSYEIEAESEEEALQLYMDDRPYTDLAPEIGDTIDGYSPILEAEQIKS